MNRRLGRLLAAIAGLTGVLVGTFAISSAAAATGQARGAGRPGAEARSVTGLLPGAAGKVRVFVLGLPSLSAMARLHVGQRFALRTLASGSFRAGADFRLTVSARDVESAGLPTGSVVNTQVVAVSDAGLSVVFAPLSWPPGPGAQASATVRLGRLPSFNRSLMTAATSPLRCTVTVIARKTAATRVGELHTVRGRVEGSFTYAGKADSFITAGLENGNHWTTSGNDQINNSGVGGSVLVNGAATNSYVESKFTFEKLHVTGTTCNFFTQMAVRWDGSPPTLGGKAPASPFRSCHADPHGFVTLKPRGSYLASGYQGVSYRTGAAAGFNGYSFGASSGYSRSVHPSWLNHGSANTFLCGSAGRNNGQHHWPIIYNQSH